MIVKLLNNYENDVMQFCFLKLTISENDIVENQDLTVYFFLEIFPEMRT
jgi:hypothetical protein